MHNQLVNSQNDFQDNSQENYQDNLNKKIEQGLAKEKKSIFGFFIKNYRVTYLLILLIFIAGLYSMMTLPRESEPEIKVPYAMVSTVYMGASPNDVEDLVTNKLEEKIENLDNLRRFTSTSGLGFSSIFVEFEAEADLQESFRKLRQEVDNARPGLPGDAEIPVVTEIRMSDYPIVTYSLVGDLPETELNEYADKVQDRLEAVKDVSKVELSGYRAREFQIIVDQNRLVHFNISLSQIIGAIQSSNFNFPAGDMSVDGFNYSIRVKGKINQADQLNNIVVATQDSSPIFLSDLAEIKDTLKEKQGESRIGYQDKESQRAVSLMVYKKTGGNILQMVEEAEMAINEISVELPDDLNILKTNDNSQFIKNDLNTLGSSGIQTFILITLILMLIISFRGALITALSVPLAFFMSFIFLKTQGMTLNSMVLFSLVLSLGLMVDNAIVIIEGINEYFEKHKKPIRQAAILSVWNFKKAITSGTMTTVSAFAPMFLVSGIMGEYLSIMPKTLIITLLSSLFVALVAMPTIISRFIKANPDSAQKNRAKKRHIIIEGLMQKLYVKYRVILSNVLPSKKKRRTIIASAWILFLLAIAMPIAGLMKIEMFPKIDFDYFTVNINLPVGSTLDKTEAITRQVEETVSQIPELDNYVTTTGGSAAGFSDGGWSSGRSSSYKAGITVNLVKAEERDRTSYDISKQLRDQLSNIQGADITVEELQAGPPSGQPIEVRIFGTETDELATIAQEVKDYFATIPGVINIDDSMQDATGEFTFVVDKQKANYYSVSTATIASTLRTAVYGTQASEVNLDNKDIDITVKYDTDQIIDIADLENILIFTPQGDNITLGQVAELKFEPALLSIYHRDGQQIVTVTADIEKDINLQKVIKGFEEYSSRMELPAGFSIGIGGETEDIEKSFREMFTSMVLAVILIAFILVLQFNSFKQPFIILFALPLSIIGAIIGLIILRQPFSITAFIGLIALAGIVVNDAIVLIDKINKNAVYGMDFVESIIDGGISRMQPILLTSLTTVAGVFPLIYADEMWRGLSLTVIFGLISSTILNLFVVPVLYASMCKKDYLKRIAHHKIYD